MILNMRNEPIRLPAWLVSLWAVLVLPILTYVIDSDGSEISWRKVATLALAGASVLIAGAETARAFVNSPATRERQAMPELPQHLVDQLQNGGAVPGGLFPPIPTVPITPGEPIEDDGHPTDEEPRS